MILFFNSCTSPFIYQSKIEIDKFDFLKSLLKVNQRSFKLIFSISVKKGLHSISFDGIIWFHPKGERTRIILIDILTREIIFDLLKNYSNYTIDFNKDSLHYLYQDDFIIKVQENIEIPSKYFIPFIQQKKIFVNPIDLINEYKSKDQIRYSLNNITQTQFIDISTKTNYIDSITLLLKNEEVLKIDYDKYKMIEDIPFARRVNLHYIPKNYHINLYFYNIIFNFKLKENTFKIKNYSD